MFTVKTNKKNTIVTANAFVPGAGYKRLLALADELGGKVDTDKKSNFAKITFGDTSNAKQFVDKFTQEYTKAHKAYTKQTKSAQGKGKKVAPSSSKKTTKGKGNKKLTLNDFVVNNPACTREEAKAYGFKGTRAELKALKVELGVR